MKTTHFQICFVDEGTANYNLDKKSLCMLNRDNKYAITTENLLRKYYGLGGEFEKYVLKNTRESYVYEPLLCCYPDDFKLVKIPKINEANKDILDVMNHSLNLNEISPYINKNIYFILQNYDESLKQIFVTIFIKIPHNEILIKEHPSYNVVGILNDEIDFSSVYIDKRKNAFIFEALGQIINFNAKILITSFSSAAFTLKYLYDYEPKVIFLYKLTKSYSSLVPHFDIMVDKLKAIYQNPDNIYVPATINEFTKILETVNNFDT